jgi:hypothetical protein
VCLSPPSSALIRFIRAIRVQAVDLAVPVDHSVDLSLDLSIRRPR